MADNNIPTEITRETLVKALKDLGLNPDDISWMEINPKALVINFFQRDEDGEKKADEDGLPLLTGAEIPVI